MDRRGFLIHAARKGSVLLFLPLTMPLPLGWALSGCGNGASSTTGAPAPPASNALQFTSDVTQNHTHDFLVAAADLTAPPGYGISSSTTTTLGHSHIVVLSLGELAQIQLGGTVDRMTTVVDGHSHVFRFSLGTAQTGATSLTSGSAGMTPSTSGTGMGTGGY